MGWVDGPTHRVLGQLVDPQRMHGKSPRVTPGTCTGTAATAWCPAAHPSARGMLTCAGLTVHAGWGGGGVVAADGGLAVLRCALTSAPPGAAMTAQLMQLLLMRRCLLALRLWTQPCALGIYTRSCHGR